MSRPRKKPDYRQELQQLLIQRRTIDARIDELAKLLGIPKTTLEVSVDMNRAFWRAVDWAKQKFGAGADEGIILKRFTEERELELKYRHRDQARAELKEKHRKERDVQKKLEKSARLRKTVEQFKELSALLSSMGIDVGIRRESE